MVFVEVIGFELVGAFGLMDYIMVCGACKADSQSRTEQPPSMVNQSILKFCPCSQAGSSSSPASAPRKRSADSFVRTLVCRNLLETLGQAVRAPALGVSNPSGTLARAK